MTNTRVITAYSFQDCAGLEKKWLSSSVIRSEIDILPSMRNTSRSTVQSPQGDNCACGRRVPLFSPAALAVHAPPAIDADRTLRARAELCTSARLMLGCSHAEESWLDVVPCRSSFVAQAARGHYAVCARLQRSERRVEHAGNLELRPSLVSVEDPVRHAYLSVSLQKVRQVVRAQRAHR